MDDCKEKMFLAIQAFYLDKPYGKVNQQAIVNKIHIKL